MPPSSRDQLGHRAAGDQVVDHRGARLLGQLAGGDQRGERRRARPRARARRPGSSGRRRRRRPGRRRRPRGPAACRSTQVGRLDRVGLVVGEGAVELEVHRHHARPARRQPLEDRGRGVARPSRCRRRPRPSAGDRRHRGQRDAGGRRRPSSTSGSPIVPGVSAVGGRLARCDEVADLGEPGLQADRGAALARHSLMPLYCAGLWLAVNIAPGTAEVAGGEVELVGGGQPDQSHVGAGLGGAARRRRGPARASWAACRGRRRPRRRRCTWTKAAAGRAASSLVDLLGHEPAHVVGLEHGAGRCRVDRVDSGLEPVTSMGSAMGRDPSCWASDEVGASSCGQHPQVATADGLARAVLGLGGSRGRRPGGPPRGPRRPARAGRRRRARAARVRGQPQHLPAPGGGEPLGCAARTGRRRAARRRSPAGRAPRSGRRRRR